MCKYAYYDGHVEWNEWRWYEWAGMGTWARMFTLYERSMESGFSGILQVFFRICWKDFYGRKKYCFYNNFGRLISYMSEHEISGKR